MFNKLGTFRLNVYDLSHCMDPTRPHFPCPSITSHTLTTFSLSCYYINFRTGQWLNTQMPRLVFPKLCVTRLEHLPYVPQIYYDFVRRHPTLREVALDFSVPTESPTSLPHLHGLVELIQGRWTLSNDRADTAFTSTIDPQTTNSDDHARLITFSAFAFSRVPSTAGAEYPASPSSCDKSVQTFSATALSLDMLRAAGIEQTPWDGIPSYLLKVIAREFDQVEELRVRTQNLYDTSPSCRVYSFDDEMVNRYLVVVTLC